MIFFAKKFLIPVCFLCCITVAFGQQNNEQADDNSYYTDYPELITTRFYFSQKYTNFTVGAEKETPALVYRPNTSLNMGVGATYRSVTLNLAYGFGFLNKDAAKGKTRYLDLQSHLYSRSWAIDVSGQFYKGYYLNNRSTGYPGKADYYVRPDIGISLLGVSAYRILNEDKFSLRAATLQNEWQQKSAGSFLIGAEIFYGAVHGDSSFVPILFKDHYDQKGIKKIHLLKFGPGAGYAYTFVYEKHYYLTWALSANISAGSVKEFSDSSTHQKFTLSPNYNYRFAIGYNGSVWACNLMLVGNEINFKGYTSSNPYDVKTGNFRINLTKRIMPGPKLKEKLRFLDDFLDR